MIILHPYQQKCRDDIKRVLAHGYKSVLLQLEPGGGKTYIAGSIIQGAKTNCLFLCNRIELVDQTIKAFSNLGIVTGLIASGYKEDYSLSVQVGSVDTVKSRLHQIPWKPGLIIHDECRGVAADGWSRIYHHWPDAYHIGLDGTPERTDGAPLRPYFSKMVKGPTGKELIAMGNLVGPRCFAPGNPDLSSVPKDRNGEFNNSRLAEVMDTPEITGSSIKHYVQYGEQSQGIIFCTRVSHSINTADAFNAVGISSIHLDGNTPIMERKRIMKAYRAGDIKLLMNVNIVAAGFDVPNVSYIGDEFPTNSIAMFKQRAARGARVYPGKEYYIYADHGGNIKRHNMLPHHSRDWDLNGKSKKSKKMGDSLSIKFCPECFYSHEPAPACPDCGHIYIAEDNSPEYVVGELKEIIEEQKKQRKLEVAQCRTYEDFKRVALERGYDPKWAIIRWKLWEGHYGAR